MKKYVYFCDKCGEEIKGHVYQIRALVKNDKGDEYKEALDGQQEKHLCQRCMTDIIDGMYPDTKNKVHTHFIERVADEKAIAKMHIDIPKRLEKPAETDTKKETHRGG